MEDSEEPASKAHYFKMGEDSLPSCLKTTDVQAACICKPYRDGKQAATVWGRGTEGVWEEGRGQQEPAPARYRAVMYPRECSGLARAPLFSARSLPLRQSHAESHLSEVTETRMCAYKVFLS